MVGVLRKVVNDHTYRLASCPLGGCTREVTLECGHKLYRKGSQPVPERAHCRECMNTNAVLYQRRIEPAK